MQEKLPNYVVPDLIDFKVHRYVLFYLSFSVGEFFLFVVGLNDCFKNGLLICAWDGICSQQETCYWGGTCSK